MKITSIIAKRGLFYQFVLAGSLLLFFTPAVSQHITGSYSASVPESDLFFLNPDYMNPAQGGGVVGIGCNPAALTGIKGRMATFALGLAKSSSGAFQIMASDSSDVYGSVYLDTKIELQEFGGLAAIGYGQQSGRWYWGVALSQPRRGGISLEAKGEVAVDANFNLNQSITPSVDPSMPVGDLPVSWDVQGRVTLSLSGKPAELYIATLPFMAAVAYKRGALSLGAGLTYQYLYSSDGVAQLNTHISANAIGIGTPTGVDPISNQPWSGKIIARVSVEDDPITATYKIDASGSRFGLNTGMKLDVGPLALGGSYGYYFRGNIKGAYQLTTVHTVDIPEDVLFSNVKLNWSNSPEVKGTLDFRTADFTKDTLSYEDSGNISLGGVHSYYAGLRLLFLGAFVGGEVPERMPDLSSLSFGVYLHTPLPKLPVRVNVGFITRTDGIRSKDSFLTPYRVVSHVGMGVAARLPINRWLHLNDHANWLRIGIRSSLVSWMLDAFEEGGGQTTRTSLPSLGDNLSVSVGMDVPL